MSGESDAERELRDIIARLEMDHRKHMKPYYDQLARIEAMKPPKPIMVYIHSGHVSFEDGDSNG